MSLKIREKNKIYREKFPELFNIATLPFYLNSLEPEKGSFRFDKNCSKLYRRPAIDLSLEYCNEKGTEPKAHCLNYDYMRPDWLRGAQIEEHKKELEEHFRILAEKYAHIIPTWEVTNETFNDTFSREFLDPHYSQFYRQKTLMNGLLKRQTNIFPIIVL